MQKYIRLTGDEELDSIVQECNEPMIKLPLKIAILYTHKLEKVPKIPLGKKGNSRHVTDNSLNRMLKQKRDNKEKYKHKTAHCYHNDDRSGYLKADYNHALFECGGEEGLQERKGFKVKNGKLVTNGAKDPPNLDNVIYLRTSLLLSSNISIVISKQGIELFFISIVI